MHIKLKQAFLCFVLQSQVLKYIFDINLNLNSFKQFSQSSPAQDLFSLSIKYAINIRCDAWSSALKCKNKTKSPFNHDVPSAT